MNQEQTNTDLQYRSNGFHAASRWTEMVVHSAVYASATADTAALDTPEPTHRGNRSLRLEHSQYGWLFVSVR